MIPIRAVLLVIALVALVLAAIFLRGEARGTVALLAIAAAFAAIGWPVLAHG
jgi:hypothetical protein